MIVASDYYFICKWLSDVVDFYYKYSIPFRLFHFRRQTRVTNITYLTKSPHAQTKYGTHIGVRHLLIEGYVSTTTPAFLSSFIRQLLTNFTIYNFSSSRVRSFKEKGTLEKNAAIRYDDIFYSGG